MADSATYFESHPWTRSVALLQETEETPWDLLVLQRQLRLLVGLHALPEQSFAGAVYKGIRERPGSRNTFLEAATKLQRKWKLGTPCTEVLGEMTAWKRDLREVIATCVSERITKAESGPLRSDVMLQTACSGLRGETAKWAQLLSKRETRVRLRRLLHGLVRGLKEPTFKFVTGTHGGDPSPSLVTLLACPCGRGTQNAFHLWTRCQYTEDIRQRAVREADAIVSSCRVTTAHRKWWSKSDHERLLHLVSTRTILDTRTERRMRSSVLPSFVAAMVSAVDECGQLNDDSGFPDVCRALVQHTGDQRITITPEALGLIPTGADQHQEE